ncbi:dihydrofolate reductase [candidate division FCPU426 bacterium]|nr:dihydrofolate reductase [candidate division FCPU426 bacterium]
MAFTIVVATDQKRGIGSSQRLPWRLVEDMRWFREITVGKNPSRENVVIMGRRTWDSLPEKFRPLPHRKNIVITRYPEKCHAPHTVSGFSAALRLAYSLGGKVFVIGGGSIYAAALRHPECEELIVTEIDHDFACDCFFPDYSGFSKHCTLATAEENGLSFRLCVYRRGGGAAAPAA